MAVRVNAMRVQLGCDPELFLADIEGKLKASCGLIGGTKEDPQPIESLGQGFAVQEDNVAVEFNIPPASTMREFVNSITRTIKTLETGIGTAYGLHFDTRCAASFPKEELESPAAQVFGCDPDYNAWTGKQNPKPKSRDETLRSCGGHIHVGYDMTKVPQSKLIKCMDLTLGIPSLLMDNGEGADKRRQLYGKAGACRYKSYGAEYRVLSNFWVHNPKLIEWAWRGTMDAMDKAVNDFNVDSYRSDITTIINKGDKASAWLMVKELGLAVVDV